MYENDHTREKNKEIEKVMERKKYDMTLTRERERESKKKESAQEKKRIR